MSSLNEQQSNTMSQVTLRHGYWFYFKHEGLDIILHGSAWSGKETVYVDNHPVSIKRNVLRRTGVHHFTRNGDQYELRLYLQSIVTGNLIVSLYKNAELIEEESKAYLRKGDRTVWWRLLGLAVAGLSSAF